MQMLRKASLSGVCSLGTGKRSCRKGEVRNLALASGLELGFELCKRHQGPTVTRPRQWVDLARMARRALVTHAQFPNRKV